MLEAAFLDYPGYKIQASHVGALIEQVDQKLRPEVLYVHLSGRYIFSKFEAYEKNYRKHIVDIPRIFF